MSIFIHDRSLLPFTRSRFSPITLKHTDDPHVRQGQSIDETGKQDGARGIDAAVMMKGDRAA